MMGIRDLFLWRRKSRLRKCNTISLGAVTGRCPFLKCVDAGAVELDAFGGLQKHGVLTHLRDPRRTIFDGLRTGRGALPALALGQVIERAFPGDELCIVDNIDGNRFAAFDGQGIPSAFFPVGDEEGFLQIRRIMQEGESAKLKAVVFVKLRGLGVEADPCLDRHGTKPQAQDRAGPLTVEIGADLVQVRASLLESRFDGWKEVFQWRTFALDLSEPAIIFVQNSGEDGAA